MNLGTKKRTGTLSTGANDMNSGLQLTNQKNSNALDKKSLKINLKYIEFDNMTDEIFGMTAYEEKNYHIASDEIDRVSDGNTIHCTEVKYSTPSDSEHIKEKGGRINLVTVPR